MKGTLQIIKMAVLVDIFAGLFYFFWTFALIVARQCGFYIDCPSSNAKIVGLFSYPAKILPDFYVYALAVSLGHSMLWLPNFLFSLVCYRDICFPDWFLGRDVPSFQVFMRLVSG